MKMNQSIAAEDKKRYQGHLDRQDSSQMLFEI